MQILHHFMSGTWVSWREYLKGVLEPIPCGYQGVTMEDFSSIKRNEVLIHATTLMNPESITLSEKSQSRKTISQSVQSLSCVRLCNPMDCSTPGFPVHHQLLELTQTHVHRVGDAIQPSHPLSSPSPAFNLSQHQGLFQWVSSSHQVAKVLEFQLQHQSC